MCSQAAARQADLGANWHVRADRQFEVAIEPLVGVELGAVPGQEEDLDVTPVLSQSGLHRLAVMRAQAFPDEEDLLCPATAVVTGSCRAARTFGLVIVDQRRLVAPVDLATHGHCARRNGWVLVIDPWPARRRRLREVRPMGYCGVKRRRHEYSPVARIDSLIPYSRSMNAAS